MDWQLLLEIWTGILWWTIGFSLAFPLLARTMACNPGQKALRQGFTTDLVYCFLLPVLNRFAMLAFLAAGSYVIFYGESFESVSRYVAKGYGPVSHLPVWAQVAVMFILSDFLLYWLHRSFHMGALWKYHAIHHSSETVDWLSTYRFHPINSWLTFALVDAVMLLIGFSPAISAAIAGFNTVYSAMVHANLNWTFGSFKYLFASPVFHRWHHTTQAEGLDKNFAPTLPLLDVVFGTFYMPEGKLPQTYGVSGSDIPHDFIGQLLWPFKAKL